MKCADSMRGALGALRPDLEGFAWLPAPGESALTHFPYRRRSALGALYFDGPDFRPPESAPTTGSALGALPVRAAAHEAWRSWAS